MDSKRSILKNRAGRLAIALMLAILFIPALPDHASALSISDYFTYTYTVQFNKPEVTGSEAFSATVSASATCVKDLPVNVSAASFTGRIVAVKQDNGAPVTLNPSYSVTLSPFPTIKDQKVQVSQSIPLQFPEGSVTGTYDVTVAIIEAKLQAVIWIPVPGGVLPASQSIGSVVYTSGSAASGSSGGSAGGGGGGGGGGAQPDSGFTGNQPTVNLLGFVSGDSHVVTKDGKLKLNVASGTRLLQSPGTPVYQFTATTSSSAPAAPGSNAVIMAYDMGPSGATFVPFITLTFDYSAISLPAGALESGLYIAWWNGTQWEHLITAVDTNANTVSANISHFSTFALLGPVLSVTQATPVPPLISPPPPAALSIPVVPVVPVVPPTLAPSVASSSLPTSPSAPASTTYPQAPQSPPLAPATPVMNWWLFSGIAVAVGVVGVGAYLFLSKRG